MNQAMFSKETYLDLITDLQAYSAIGMWDYCVAHNLDFKQIPVPNLIYVNKTDGTDRITPIAYIDVATENPKIIFMQFEGEQPSFTCIPFKDFLENYTEFTRETESKLSIVSQPTSIKS